MLETPTSKQMASAATIYSIVVYRRLHCKTKFVVLTNYLLLQLRDCLSYTNSKNVVLVKTFCGRLV